MKSVFRVSSIASNTLFELSSICAYTLLLILLASNPNIRGGNPKCFYNVIFDEIINNGDDTFTIIIKQIEGKNSLNLSTILDINEKFKLDKIEYKVKELLFAQNQDNILTSCLLKFDELETVSFKDNFIIINPFKNYTTKEKIIQF